MPIQREREIEQNFQFFQEAVSSLLPSHYGEFALLRNKEIKGVFPKAIEAMTEGYNRFEDGLFSVQRVIDRPLDLGFMSYGSDDRTAD
jgi:hypothetical protein